MEKRVRRRCKQLNKYLDLCPQLIRRLAIKIETILKMAEEGIVWFVYTDKKGRRQIACGTTVGFEHLREKEFRNRYVKLYDLITQKVIAVPIISVQGRMSPEMIEHTKRKMKPARCRSQVLHADGKK